MASHVRTHAGGQLKSASSTWNTALSANVATGNTLLLVASFDNRSTGLGGGPTVTGISVPTTETTTGTAETASWQLLVRLDAPSGTGGSTVVTELWGIVTTKTWLSTFIPVVTISVAVGGHAAAIDEWNGLTLTARSSGSNLSTVGTPAASASTVAAGDVLIGAFGFESAIAPTGDSDTTNGSWSSVLAVSTSGGTDTANVTAGLQTKIATAGGAQTFNPVGANDAGAILVSLQPTAAAIPFGSATGSWVFTGSAVGNAPANPIASGAATGTFTFTGAAVGVEHPRGAAVGAYAYRGVVDPLKTFWTALAARTIDRVNIGVLGCSLVEGFPVTPDKTIEQYLAAKYSATHGYGVVPIPTAAMVGITMFTVTPGTGGSVGTSNATNGWGANHQVWFTNGALAAPPILVCTIVNGPWTSFDIDLLRVATYSTTAGKYRVDGGAWVNFSLATASGQQVEKLHVDTPVNSTIEVSIETGNSTSFSIVEDIVGYKGDETAGVAVHNFGHSGYRVNQWRVDANPTYGWRQAQALQSLDLLIVSDLGVNDAQTLGSAQFETDLIDFLDYLREVHAVPILLVAVQDLEGAVSFVEDWDNYADIIIEQAKVRGWPWLDLRGVIPTYAEDPSIYYTDHTHGAADGSMYTLMADEFYDAIAPAAETPNEGTAGGAWTYAGTAVGQRHPQGSASGAWAFSGAASGASQPEGTAGGSWAFSGSATGSAPTGGTASGSYQFTGSASGSSPNGGTASGVYMFAGVANGETQERGLALGQFTFHGSAVGVAPSLDVNEGSALGEYQFTGSAVGNTQHRGTASGTFTFTGATAGESDRSGQAVGSFTFTGSALGETETSGTAAGLWTYTGSAAGTTDRSGVASGDFAFTGQAHGQAPTLSVSTGTADGVWTFIGSAVGATLSEGVCVGLYGWLGAAVGTAPGVGPQQPAPPERSTVIPPQVRVTVIPAELRRTVYAPDPRRSIPTRGGT